MSLMLSITLASSAAAPLSLPLRSSSAALRLTSVRAAPLSLRRSSAAVRSPRLSAAFSASACSLQSSRVNSVSVSAPPSALSASAAPPLADLSQSAAHSRLFSTKQVGSSLSAPLRDQSSASVSSLFRPSAASSAGLRSIHFSAAAFAHAASASTSTRTFPRKSDASPSSLDVAALTDLQRRLEQQMKELMELTRRLTKQTAQPSGSSHKSAAASAAPVQEDLSSEICRLLPPLLAAWFKVLVRTVCESVAGVVRLFTWFLTDLIGFVFGVYLVCAGLTVKLWMNKKEQEQAIAKQKETNTNGRGNSA